MNILITGASGFIGQHLVLKLATSNHNIMAIRKSSKKTCDKYSSIKWLCSDLSDKKYLKDKLVLFNPEIVIHLAWEGIPDYSESLSRKNLKNSMGFFDIIFNFTSCRKIIATGSCWEYGKTRGECREDNTPNIKSYFAWAKNSLYEYLKIKTVEQKITLNWFRLFYVFGPKQKYNSLLPTLIKSIFLKKEPIINQPLNKNDFIYVGDVINALMSSIDNDLLSGAYNLGSGFSTSVFDLCIIVEKLMLGTSSISEKILNEGSSKKTIDFWASMEKTKNGLKSFNLTNVEEAIKIHINSLKIEMMK